MNKAKRVALAMLCCLVAAPAQVSFGFSFGSCESRMECKRVRVCYDPAPGSYIRRCRYQNWCEYYIDCP